MKKAALADLHTHTTFCDGTASVEAMIQAAKDAGLGGIGFSGHSYAPFDPTCIGVKDESGYLRAIRSCQKAELAEGAKAEGKSGFTILCGVEQDYYAPVKDLSLYDYFIGSVHYLKVGESYIGIDNPDIDLREIAHTYYGGNGLTLVEDFFATTLENISTYKPTIIGHFDLITKLNGRYGFFDEFGLAYQSLAKEAFRKAVTLAEEYGGLFELNTGGINRGYREVAYPAPYLLKEHVDRARIIITSDSHGIGSLGFQFSEQQQVLRELGFSRMSICGGGRFQEIPL